MALVLVFFRLDLDLLSITFLQKMPLARIEICSKIPFFFFLCRVARSVASCVARSCVVFVDGICQIFYRVQYYHLLLLCRLIWFSKIYKAFSTYLVQWICFANHALRLALRDIFVHRNLPFANCSRLFRFEIVALAHHKLRSL